MTLSTSPKLASQGNHASQVRVYGFGLTIWNVVFGSREGLLGATERLV